MSEDEITQVSAELLRRHPGASIKAAPDGAELVAEIDPKLAVAVIERSQAHFHTHTTETYRVLEGRLYLDSGGSGHVLEVGDSFVIEPGKVHYARGAAASHGSRSYQSQPGSSTTITSFERSDESASEL